MHRPTNPFFLKEKKSRFTSQRSTRSWFINNNWYDVMSFYLIKIDTMFFKGCFDIRVNMHLLPSDYYI